MRRQRHRPLPPAPAPTPAEIRAAVRRKIAADREMWAFDNLAPVVRRAMVQSALPPNSELVREQIQSLMWRLGMARPQVEAMVALAQPLVDDDCIVVFAEEYEKQFGVPLPHVAARATVLRQRD